MFAGLDGRFACHGCALHRDGGAFHRLVDAALDIALEFGRTHLRGGLVRGQLRLARDRLPVRRLQAFGGDAQFVQFAVAVHG